MRTDTIRFKKTGVARAAIAVLCGTASMMVAQETLAQQQSLQRVEITGSNIRRADAETASPVQVITQQEIVDSGKGTVAEYLQTLTSDGQGSVPFTYGRGFSGATSSGISLRGLGANATLVLINGRRVTSAVLADDAQRSYVDLNQIPLEAVDRVEVLKDGASALYGSDAVAGVVNIILKKTFVGTVVKATYGVSEEGDGEEPRIAITHGMGDINKDGYNLLLNFETGKKDPIWYRDRAGRGTVGVSAIGHPQYGFGFNPYGGGNNLARHIGQGTIPLNATGGRVANSNTASLIGNVRNPTTNFYYSRSDATAGNGFTRPQPGAQAYCNSIANLPQVDPAGGCLFDPWMMVGQIQPTHETTNFFGRFSKTLGNNWEAFVDLGLYNTSSRVTNNFLQFQGGLFRPDGSVQSNVANTQLGAAHPDNPYFGSAVRLSYSPYEIGGNVTESSGRTWRTVAGVKGTWGAWDIDTALNYSDASQTDVSKDRINWRVLQALLNPTAANVAAASGISDLYRALPAGTFYRIGENAVLNTPEVYRAVYQDQQRTGNSRTYGADFKVSREFGKLQGGPIGFAAGIEYRHEMANLPFYNGLGNYIGLSLTSYGGERDIWAGFVEGIFPVTKQLELSAAARYDNYSDAGEGVTGKLGAKWRPIPTLALRGTYQTSFRAPSFTENGATSIAAFGGATVNDNARCAADPAIPTTNCIGIAPTFLQAGNPGLEPEKAQSITAGVVWDITPKTSVTADVFQIKRKGLPVIEDPQSAVDAGRITRDPATAVTPLDPGGILNGFVVFQNSNESLTQGVDVELKHRWDLGGGWGRLNAALNWSHLFKQRVTQPDGTVFNYAGTHGDCHITNCIGTPKDRITASVAWDYNQWRLGANFNYRGSMSNREEATSPCWSEGISLPAGQQIPGDCKIASFYTVDLFGTWKFGKNTEVFGTISNLFDKKPPFDPQTYGAIGYNPLDYSGAIGRFYRIGVKHRF
jgi:iron complex outermembrane receptor protein